MMKWLILTIAFTILLMPSAAQSPLETCPEAVNASRDLIAMAHDALAVAKYDDAQILLTNARQLVTDTCDMVTTQIEWGGLVSSSATVTLPDISPMDGVAYVRVLNAVADYDAPIDITLDGFGEVVTGLGYGEFTGLIPIPSGMRGFNTMSWHFLANSTWVIAAVGLDENGSVMLEPIPVVRDEWDGKAHVRIIQSMNPEGQLNVTSVEGMDFGTGLEWLNFHDITVEPGNYTLYADGRMENGVIIPETDFTFAADRNYTIFLTGSEDTTDAPQFVTLINSQDITRVRFTNTLAESVDIHSRPGNNKIVGALEPGATSDWVEIHSGAAAFTAYGVGMGLRGDEKASLSESLYSGRDLTLSIGSDGQITVQNVAFTQ